MRPEPGQNHCGRRDLALTRKSSKRGRRHRFSDGGQSGSGRGLHRHGGARGIVARPWLRCGIGRAGQAQPTFFSERAGHPRSEGRGRLSGVGRVRRSQGHPAPTYPDLGRGAERAPLAGRGRVRCRSRQFCPEFDPAAPAAPAGTGFGEPAAAPHSHRHRHPPRRAGVRRRSKPGSSPNWCGRGRRSTPATPTSS